VVHLVVVRDSGSLRLLSELVGRDRLRLAADGIFLDGFPTRDAPGPCPPSILALTDGSGRPVIGINIRLWFHFASSLIPHQFSTGASSRRSAPAMAALEASFAEIIRHLRRDHDARVLLISMYEPDTEPWEDDVPFLKRIKDRFFNDPEVVLWQDDVPIEDLFRLFARLDLMIGMRLHSTLIALRAGVPAIHVTYTLKGRDIFADLNLADWAIEVEEAARSPASVARCAEAILADPQRFARVSAITAARVAENERAWSEAMHSFAGGC
jgi:polysaccharide pyruvyl transferase WcaK-like protein